VFSTRSLPRCYKEGQLAVAVELVGELETVVKELVGFSRCELLLLEAGNWDREQFGIPEEGEGSLLEAVTKQQLVKMWLWTVTCVCVCVYVCVHACVRTRKV
jgi:hypothetical protein